MSKSCTILAHVRNSKGEIVESRLFNDLLHYTSNNRELAKEYYAVGTSEDFLSKVRDSEDFQTDENGEITFKSLRSLAKMDLETDKVIKVLNKDIGEGEYSYEEALNRITEFNENNSWSDKMLATMIPSGRGKYFVSVVPKTKNVTDVDGKEKEERNTLNEQQKLHNTIRNKELEKRLISLLRSHGVSVKFLEGDEKGGRYSTENVVQMENGLYGLIEVNEKGTTSEVFAEEAGHFAVGALGDNPLVKRLENLLGDPAVQWEALGKEEFDNANLGKNPAREVAGRLVGKALMRKLDNGAPYKVLANRIANLAKRVFYGITGNEVRWAAAKAEQIANRIAYQFVEGSDKFSVQNAINIKETMLDSRLTMNQKVYRDVMDEMGRMVKRLEALSQDQFTGQMQASLAMSVISGSDNATGQTALQMVDSVADTFAFDGIVQSLVQITDYLGPGKEIDQLMKAVNLENPSEFYQNMARNGRYLRQARTFIRSAEIIIDTINSVLDKNHLGGTITLANGSTIHDVKYQDENGTWRSIDLMNALTTYRNIIAATKSELTNLESAYFARFCEDIYGSKYITSTTGILWSDIWHGQQALGEQSKSIADMVMGEGMEDIDVFHRYLGSMSNNPDVIGQIADKLVKSANKVADDMTIKYQERLIILKERAEKLGLNVADLVERDDNDIPTGNMITPPAAPTQEGNREEDFIYDAYMAELGFVPAVHNGRWESERDAFKEQMWEDFKAANPDWESMSGFTRGYKWDQFLRPKMKDWNNHHSIKVEVKDASGEVLYTKWVPNLIYQSDQWDNLKAKYPNKNGNSLEQWVNDYRKIKEELDSMLPVGATVSHRLPQFRGTFMNSVRNSVPLEKGLFKKVNAWRKTFGRRVILESFVETSEDYDYGSLHTMNSPEEELLGTKLNYEEERTQRLPVFGINKMKNMQDLSTDLFHSMLSYAAMATSYQCLDNVVDGLEVGREALYNRNIQGKQNWVEKGAKKLGNTFRSPSGRHEAHDTGTKNRAYGRYIKFLDKQVYGISATYWGIPIGKGKRLLLNKLIQNISSLGGTLFLKGNVLGGAVNTLTGFNNIFKEAVTSEYFSPKDWAYAHKYYFSHFPEMWSTDLGELRKENKLNLFLEQMDVQNNNREKFRSWHTTRSRLNNFYRMVGYLPYSSGDHYMQAMAYLATAHGTKLYDTDGSEKTNVWDAYHVIDNIDSEGKFSAGKSLQFERFCPLNASDITSEALDKEGVFLKAPSRGVLDFEEWLVWQDANFADETYRRNHAVEYNSYRDTFNKLTDQQLMQYKATRYNALKSILEKVETYLKSPSPLSAVPSFTPEEQTLLSYNGVGTGNYADILQLAQMDLYSMVWTQGDNTSYIIKCREINIRNHGIYNEQDKTAWHQNWYTNAFLAMKGWALGYLEMMYSNNHYSTILGKNVEGFVNTAAKIPMYVLIGAFTGRSMLAWKDMLISMINPWSKRTMKALTQAGFSEHQVFNARRMVASELLMTALWILRLATARPSGGDDDDDKETDPTIGGIHYLSMRTLLEQEALLYIPETFVQTGQLMDFLPVGFAAICDIGKLGYEGVGAMVVDETDSNFFYQKDAKDGRYDKYDTKFEHHLERIVPYWKSWWAIQHPYEATDNYEFGRKLRTR